MAREEVKRGMDSSGPPSGVMAPILSEPSSSISVRAGASDANRYVMLCYVILSHRATRTQRVKVRSHHAQCHPLIGFMRRQNPMPGCRRCGRTRITGRCR